MSADPESKSRRPERTDPRLDPDPLAGKDEVDLVRLVRDIVRAYDVPEAPTGTYSAGRLLTAWSLALRLLRAVPRTKASVPGMRAQGEDGQWRPAAKLVPADDAAHARAAALEGLANTLTAIMARWKRQRRRSLRSDEQDELLRSADALDAGLRGPLTEQAGIVLEILEALPPGHAMTGPKILDTLADRDPPIFLDSGVLTGRIIPALRAYGVRNKRRVGYYLAE